MKIIPVLLFWAAILAGPAQAMNFENMAVAVRAGIDLDDKHRRDKDPASAADSRRRPRVFLLGSVTEARNGTKLEYPVDGVAIAAEVKRVLIAQGFRPVAVGEKPQTVLTVEYGMGRLPNPYSDENTASVDPTTGKLVRMHLDDKAYNNLSDSDIFTPWRDFSDDPNRRKAIQADQPQLIIQIRAWKYPPPPNPKKKPTMLWMTTMHVDDPEHRDLNQVYKVLLAQGAPYFDRHIDRGREVVVDTGIPEGQVKIGHIKVVDDKKRP